MVCPIVYNIWQYLKIPCPTGDVWLGGMIRGYDSGYDSWVWFADLDLVFPCILQVWLFTHTYPANLSTVGNYTIRGDTWSALELACLLLSEWCVRFGVGMLVPLQDAAAGCCCQIFLRSSRWRRVARGKWLQRKELTKHKFWSCKRTKVQNWEVWGMVRVWFGHDSGYDSEIHFFWIREDLLLESLFPTVNLLRLLLNGCNGSTCQTTLDRTWT